MDYLTDHLRVLRSARKLTQEYIAQKIGVDQSKYSRMERGIDPITVTHLNIIAGELGIKVHELMEKAQRPPF